MKYPKKQKSFETYFIMSQSNLKHPKEYTLYYTNQIEEWNPHTIFQLRTRSALNKYNYSKYEANKLKNQVHNIRKGELPI